VIDQRHRPAGRMRHLCRLRKTFPFCWRTVRKPADRAGCISYSK
jgi:hypothetical protein